MRLFVQFGLLSCLVVSAGGHDLYMQFAPSRQLEFAGLDARLKSGDFSPIETGASQKDAVLLWHVFDEWDGASPVAIKARDALLGVPGHAVLLADRVEYLTNTSSNANNRPSRDRFWLIEMLGKVGSPEAIQQIGRFLYDTRNPVAEASLVGGTVQSVNQPAAVSALHAALGPDSPLSQEIRAYDRAGDHPFYVQKLLEWWASSSSLRFRTKLEGVELPAIVQNPPVIPHVDYKPPARLPPAPKIESADPLPVSPDVQRMYDERKRKMTPPPFLRPPGDTKSPGQQVPASVQRREDGSEVGANGALASAESSVSSTPVFGVWIAVGLLLFAAVVGTLLQLKRSPKDK